MKGRISCFVMVLQIVSWVSATSRPLHHQPGPSRSPQPQQITSIPNQVHRSMERMANGERQTLYGRSKIGSAPPSCKDKCFGCNPCKAIQIPTTTRGSGSGGIKVQYANYAPEHWECKCGTAFYKP